jgi:hypothetical protein
MIATFEIRVRLCMDGTLDHRTYRLDLHAGYARRLPPASHHRVNAGSGKHWEPLDNGPAEKDVTREEGERNSFDAVFPLVSGGIEGEERLKTFPRKDLMNTLLVLMASI